MDITVLFLILVAILFFAAFFQEIFPQCACCRFYKLRYFFRLHKNISFFESVHVCKRCSRKYCINTLKDYRSYEKIKCKVSVELLSPNLTKTSEIEDGNKKSRSKYSE